ncbi:thiamine pyrophosphate-dependent enzyme, partial [Paenibacillus sp. 598K]|uniref:thiamine pyrophosphate-dependent enzyme n=1 Tax=Paenibacillus sp. 598K TaxID=1117987 RepID=UPI0021A9FCBB
GGTHYADAGQELIAFAERFGIPVTETQAGKSILPWDHPLNMGGIGVTGTLAANRLAREADLILGIGTRYSDFTTASKSAFDPDVRFVNLNVNGADTAKLSGLALTADAKAGLQALQHALEDSGYLSSYSEGELAAHHAAWAREVDRLHALESAEGLVQTRALGIIQHALAPSDVIVCAAGSMPGDLQRLWRPVEPGTYHMEYGFSCMGYEVSGAFGAKLAEPDRDVYALVGDGSYLMLHSELLTAIQEGVKLTVLLLDNHGFQCIHNLQRGHGSDGFGNEFRRRDAATGRL